MQRHVWDPSFDSGIHPDHCECTDLRTLVKARPQTDLAEITERNSARRDHSWSKNHPNTRSHVMIEVSLSVDVIQIAD